MTLTQVTDQADLIFVGRVVDVRAEWETDPHGRHIVTVVTFDVLRVIKGHVGLRTQLTFLGGTLGRDRLEVSGMPTFTIDERDVLFVSPDAHAMSPLVGLWHGRFPIVLDRTTGDEIVRTHDGRTLMAGFDARPANGRAALTVAQFEALVRDRMSRSLR